MYILQLKTVNKSYNSVHAVSDISLDVPGNTIFGLLGPNGAGKTTTMRMIMNIIAPDSGEIILFGEPFRESLKNRI
jgi:ABC-2 type transport system ATP-binding protein